ncbi:MAG: hypothetical protein ACRC4M_02050 [Mycoplasma sp.]
MLQRELFKYSEFVELGFDKEGNSYDCWDDYENEQKIIIFQTNKNGEKRRIFTTERSESGYERFLKEVEKIEKTITTPPTIMSILNSMYAYEHSYNDDKRYLLTQEVLDNNVQKTFNFIEDNLKNVMHGTKEYNDWLNDPTTITSFRRLAEKENKNNERASNKFKFNELNKNIFYLGDFTNLILGKNKNGEELSIFREGNQLNICLEKNNKKEIKTFNNGNDFTESLKEYENELVSFPSVEEIKNCFKEHNLETIYFLKKLIEQVYPASVCYGEDFQNWINDDLIKKQLKEYEKILTDNCKELLKPSPELETFCNKILRSYSKVIEQEFKNIAKYTQKNNVELLNQEETKDFDVVFYKYISTIFQHQQNPKFTYLIKDVKKFIEVYCSLITKDLIKQKTMRKQNNSTL